MSAGWIVPALLALLHVAAIICALKAVRTARTAQGAVGWVIFLLAAPYVAIPCYLFLGHSRFPGYVSARRASRAVMGALEAMRRAHQPAAEIEASGSADAFARLSGMPVVSCNTADILIDGDATFDAIFAALDDARSYVLIATYILRDDRLGRALQERVIAKARQGVRIRILYDALGSHGLPDAYVATLRAAGVEIHDFHSIRRAHSRFQVNFRNHRKIVVVDGRVAFVGGLNVGDEYMGRDPAFGPWRDTHLRLCGPVVSQAQLVFAEDWHWATEHTIDLAWDASTPAPGEGATLDALILAPGPADTMETGSLYFCNAIAAARRRVWIASPYFVPDVDILTALKLAALRGVDVRILVADHRDHLLVWLAAFAFFDEVRAAGVQIRRYAEGFMHQKALVVDDRFASIGSVNLDNRSCRLNFEITALVFDRGFAGRVAAMLEADFARSFAYETPLQEAASRLRRYGAPVARLFAPIL